MQCDTISLTLLCAVAAGSLVPRPGPPQQPCRHAVLPASRAWRAIAALTGSAARWRAPKQASKTCCIAVQHITSTHAGKKLCVLQCTTYIALHRVTSLRTMIHGRTCHSTTQNSSAQNSIAYHTQWSTLQHSGVLHSAAQYGECSAVHDSKSQHPTLTPRCNLTWVQL